MAAAKKPEQGSLLAGLNAQAGDVEAGPALITRLITNPGATIVGTLNASYLYALQFHV